MIEQIHWLGHASFKIAVSKIIYIDPYQISDGEKADIILITHDHYDHLSLDDIAKVARPDTVYVAPESAARSLHGDVRTMKPGDTIALGDIAIEAVAAYNMNKAFHPKENNWLGYVLTIQETRIYHAGDSDVIPEMKQMKVDIALLPCGGTYTMSAQAAAEVALKVGAKIVVPMHWGSIIGSRADAEELSRLCPEDCEVKILQKE